MIKTPRIIVARLCFALVSLGLTQCAAESYFTAYTAPELNSPAKAQLDVTGAYTHVLVCDQRGQWLAYRAFHSPDIYLPIGVSNVTMVRFRGSSSDLIRTTDYLCQVPIRLNPEAGHSYRILFELNAVSDPSLTSCVATVVTRQSPTDNWAPASSGVAKVIDPDYSTPCGPIPDANRMRRMSRPASTTPKS